MPNDSDDATLPDTGSFTDPVVRVSDPGIDRRYKVGDVLGRGGMGEVRLARDQRIHRDVAVKLMKSATANDEMTARFLREAQVQGALEHPAIPPVHDLGVDKDGQPYFVMKRLAGITLGELLEQRGSSDVLQTKWPRRLLLTRLVDVCLAIEFAHTRGVVHRDLKPANIMLGDFGETYVLDWGLARITNEELSVQALSGEVEVGQTIAGALLGTPGYMAPEQARGEAIDARADVYALGCILYEILTGVPALPRGLPGLDATLTTLEHRPSKRTDVPPELDKLCARATAQDRANRPTARQLGEGIQAYLDGDRDTEARRTLAIECVERATKLLAEPGDVARADAMRAASRALALDATNARAQEIVAHLVIEPPKTPPREAIAQADIERGKARQRTFKWAAITYGGLVPGVGLTMLLFRVHHVWPFVLTMSIIGTMAVLFVYLGRFVLGMRSKWFFLVLVLNLLLMVSASFILGPLLVLPIFLVGSLAGFVMSPTSYSPAIVVASHITAFMTPVVLELCGVTPSTFSIANGSLTFTPWAVELTPGSTTLILVLAVIAQFANTTAIGLAGRRGQERSLDQVHVQSWHLQQLVPREKDK